MPWIGAVIGAVGSYMSAKEQSKAAKKAGAEQTTYRSPYGNEYIARIFPYLLANQQNVFESRMRGYGLEPTDFSPIGKMLAGISPEYSGVMKPGIDKSKLGDISQYGINPSFRSFNLKSQEENPRPRNTTRIDRFDNSDVDNDAPREPDNDIDDRAVGVSSPSKTDSMAAFDMFTMRRKRPRGQDF